MARDNFQGGIKVGKVFSVLIEFRAQDGLTVDISEATVVTLYMFKRFNNALLPKLQQLKPGSRVVAHDFDIGDWKPTHIEYITRPAEDSSDYAESRAVYLESRCSAGDAVGKRFNHREYKDHIERRNSDSMY